MSRIIRVSKRENYTVLDNHFVNDEVLSWKATGILAYLLSKPNDWAVRSQDLAGRKRNGRDAVRAALRELEAAGYLIRNVIRRPNGTMFTESTVFERPILNTNGDSSESNQSGLSGVGLSGVGFPVALLSTEELSTELFPVAAAPGEGLGKKAKAKKAVHPDLGQWFGYSKAALSEKYPGYVFEPKQNKGLRLIFEKSCKSDLVKAKAFLQCALADGDRFVTNLRHDPMFLYSNANRWLTASRGWSGFKPELDSQKAAREQARLAQVAESDRQRREAEELERVRSDLSTLRPGDLETLRAAWLSTVPGDHIFRSRWAEADWRENAAVMAGIYGALQLRRKVNAGVLL